MILRCSDRKLQPVHYINLLFYVSPRSHSIPGVRNLSCVRTLSLEQSVIHKDTVVFTDRFGFRTAVTDSRTFEVQDLYRPLAVLSIRQLSIPDE